VWKEKYDAKWILAQWCHGFIVVPDGAESPKVRTDFPHGHRRVFWFYVESF
jgi:hypothetical protein